MAVLDAQDRPLPVGATGEVCVRGDTVMRGYLDNEAATAATLAGGWLHTGDLGRGAMCSATSYRKMPPARC
ncbi:MAG: AMP-binding protein [Burkholderiaceae bacterium]|nr:AMP-binding protein [Burkholderiaceae bacterium]